MTSLLLTLLLSQVPAEPADDEPPKLDVLSVELNSWNLPFNSVAITFERALTAHLSVAGGLVAEERWLDFARGAPHETEFHFYTGGIRTWARWYPGGTAPSGLWLGSMAAASVSGTSIVAVEPGPRVSDGLLLTAGAFFGFNGQFPFGAVLQVSGGVRADWATLKATYPDSSGALVRTTDRWFAVSPIAYLGVGWAF